MLLSTEDKGIKFLRNFGKYLKCRQGVTSQKRNVRTKNFVFALFSYFVSHNIYVREPQNKTSDFVKCCKEGTRMSQYWNFSRYTILWLSLYWMYGRDNAVAISQHFGEPDASFFKEEGFFCCLEYRSSKISFLVNICLTTRQHVPEH